jgi:hypothetical protein|tara:strand:- start:20873 stop:21082 length:210 start_codon:yes stop_codon:yes gene_type:complete
MKNNKSNRIYDFYRVVIVDVKYPNVSDFDAIERKIEADDEFGLMKILLSKVATARSHMLDRLNKAMGND